MKKLSREELAFYINKSTNGDDSASLFLGNYYYSIKDLYMSNYFLTRSAEHGNREAIENILNNNGTLNLNIKYQEKDKQLFITWAKKGLELDDFSIAPYYLYSAYSLGYGVEADGKKAKEYLDMACMQGNFFAFFAFVAEMYSSLMAFSTYQFLPYIQKDKLRDDHDCMEDFQNLKKYYKAYTQHLDCKYSSSDDFQRNSVKLTLAKIYIDLGEKDDQKEAFDIIEKIINEGFFYEDSFYLYATCLYRGIGTKKDAKKLREFFLKHKKKLLKSESYVAFCAENRICLHYQEDASILKIDKWNFRAVFEHHLNHKYKEDIYTTLFNYLLGVYFFYGFGCEVNYESSFKLLKKVADGVGYPDAMYYVSYMYKHGLGTKYNSKEGRKYESRGITLGSDLLIMNLKKEYQNSFDNELLTLLKYNYGPALVYQGSYYLHADNGGKKGIELARQYYKKAMSIGYKPGYKYYILSWLYKMENDSALLEAEKGIEKAKKDHADAYYAYAFYEMFNSNYLEAYRYLALGARLHSRNCIDAMMDFFSSFNYKVMLKRYGKIAVECKATYGEVKYYEVINADEESAQDLTKLIEHSVKRDNLNYAYLEAALLSSSSDPKDRKIAKKNADYLIKHNSYLGYIIKGFLATYKENNTKEVEESINMVRKLAETRLGVNLATHFYQQYQNESKNKIREIEEELKKCAEVKC